ncbi:hypothetical protein BDE02_04G031500 [Populus trichocarpa]|nr:hypothetical protein BDE02_04G031500 [Populus trichocarpa]
MEERANLKFEMTSGKDQQRHLNLEIQREKRSYWHQISKIFSWGSLASEWSTCTWLMELREIQWLQSAP